jgi:hypothetical protein
MSIAVQTALVGVAVWGVRMFARGRRGRTIDDHPVCARCAFDLTGLPLADGTCPECGTRLASRDAVRIGNRRRRHGLMYGGLAIAVVAAVPPATSLVLTAAHVDPIRIEPPWLLLREATGTSQKQQQACGELLYRVQHGWLSEANEQRVVAAALRLQADLSRPWDPRWGDMIEAVQAAGRLPAADWQTYLSHDEPITLFEVRPRCARGDPIPFHVRGELRGAAPSTVARKGRLAVWVTVPGAVTERPEWSGGLGLRFEVSGIVSLTADSAARLKLGSQSIAVTFGGLASYGAATPSLFRSVTCQGTWTLLGDGEKSVQLYADDRTATAAMKSLSSDVDVDVESNGSVSVTIDADRPPVDLAFDGFLRADGREWNAPGCWIILERGQWHAGGMVAFEDASQLIGHRADIVLRPSIAAAAHTVHINRLLDHEFVFKDVLIANTR